MTSKFREALDYFKEASDEHYDYATSWAGMTYHLKTIRQALRIAERLESGEVSDELRYAIWRAQYEQSNKNGHPDSVLHDCAMARVKDKNQREIDTVAIKAMAKVMIEEVDNEK